MADIKQIEELEEKIRQVNFEYRQAMTEYLKSLGLKPETHFKKINKFGKIEEFAIHESKEKTFLYKRVPYGNYASFNSELLKNIVEVINE